jgi:hypothetical protein
MKYHVFDHCTTVHIWDFFKKSDYFISFLGDLTEIDETSHSGRESVKPIESMNPGNQEGTRGFQMALFDST